MQQLLPPQDFILSQTTRIEFAYELLRKNEYDVLLICQYQPGGLELIQFAAEIRYPMRIFFLSAVLTPELRVRAFKQGADDVMRYPFQAEELVLRLERLLVYQKEKPYQKLLFGKLTLFPQQGLVLADNKRVPIRKKELQILLCLLRSANTVVTREMMIDTLWGENIPMYSTIDSYIRRLRFLLGSRFVTIKTVRGYGYMAVPVGESKA